ncbi:hypothetical protein FOE78_04970 [Microlunatus elymi]|uniref:TrbL/VirB6 plasmid conjugal transfer protein n=1 Tax=Microlunatus elymi TaxID=2596828 RepID=A0A516PW14_9ACTN|nr:hypothetical protein [Microlunatus elymi]QDP95349.1 hypothetical protein FOE78_04970 [Microlunatus elymi]
MRRTSRLRSIIAALLLAATVLATAVPAAHAAPTTRERRSVAEDVAQSVCRTVPPIIKLPKDISPNKLCRSVIVENIDPEGNNSGIRAACGEALGKVARPVTRFCTSVFDKMLDPARALFLDKVAPVAQKLKCVTTAPAAFDCLAKQVHIWLERSIVSLWQGLLTILTSGTQAIAMLDGWHNPGIVSLYSDVGSLGAVILLGVLLISLIISAVRLDVRHLGHALFGVIVWGLFWSAGAAVAVMLMKASDEVSRWLAGRPDKSGATDLDRAGKQFADWVEYVSGAANSTVGPSYDVGSFTAILVCLLLIIAIVAALVALLMRNIALLMIVMALPLTLAGTAGPRMTREWFNAAVRMFVALLLAKPLIVIAVRLGAVLVSVPARGQPQATFSDALLGVSIILLAALLPGVIYRFSGGLTNTSAGAAPRASAGYIGQSAQSATSSVDLTRVIMERNAPRPMLAGRPPQPAVAGTTSTGARGGGLAGPIGIAAVTAALAGGTIESGGRWLAGHAATGGGVLGDVEGPHVPSPPISRGPHGARDTSQSSDHRGSASQQDREPRPEPAQLTIVQTPSHVPQRPAIAPRGIDHLIIPGSVVDDRQLELPPAQQTPTDQGQDSDE